MLSKWLKGLPLARRPLVKLSAKVAPEPAVKMLQVRVALRGSLQQSPVLGCCVCGPRQGKGAAVRRRDPLHLGKPASQPCNAMWDATPLQAALPPRAREQAPVELENVAPTLLLPPTGRAGAGRSGPPAPREPNFNCCRTLPAVACWSPANGSGVLSARASAPCPSCPRRKGRHGGGPGRRCV